MCEFKSGIILKNKIVLCPKDDESHSNLLESLNIDDNYANAARVFVRAELIPPNGNIVKDISEWQYKVDQDIVPDWYENDRKKYEDDFRAMVEEWVSKNMNFVEICGRAWTPVVDGEYTYYYMYGMETSMRFGDTNDYKKSDVRKDLNNSDLLKELKEKFKDDLVQIHLDLTAMDGMKDYGSLDEDLIGIPTIGLLMKHGDQIPLVGNWYWLATPNQTPTRNDSSFVQFVSSNGRVGCNGCRYDGGVRPFFILKSSISVSSNVE